MMIMIVYGKVDVKYHSGEYSSYHKLDWDVKRTELDDFIEDHCDLVQFHYFGRHGARYPFKSMVDKFKDIERKINSLGNDFPKLPSFFRNWNLRTFTDNPSYGDLTWKGIQELYDLAKRYRTNVSGLNRLLQWKNMDVTGNSMSLWNSDEFHFQSSQYIHTSRSASSFAYGPVKYNIFSGERFK